MKSLVIGIGAITLCACGGGGGGGDEADAMSGAPAVTITSHTNGDRIVGDRLITIAGDIGGTADTVEATFNGESVPVTFDGDAFELDIDLVDQDNELVVSASNSNGSDQAELALFYPYLDFDNFAAAEVVIGQTDFTDTVPALMSSGLSGPFGNVGIGANGIYVPDTGHNRILYFSPIPTTNGAEATLALGQDNLMDAGSALTATGLYNPQSVSVSGDVVAVADYNNGRVLLYSPEPTTSGEAAAVVVGQDDFTSNNFECDSDSAPGAQGVTIAGDKLLVADSDNHRVMIWSSIPTTNGQAADLVLGQGDFSHCDEDDDDQNGVSDATPSNRTVEFPQDAWTDGERLVVADTDNNRVLIWNEFPTSSFTPASVVLGQGDFSGESSTLGGGGLSRPYFVASNGNQLFIADANHNRVLIYNVYPTANGTSAARVLGQSNFDRVTSNDDNQDGADDGAATARVFDSPRGVSVSDDALFVTDQGNHRVLIFRP